MNNIDTTIQHITPAGGNLFAELGFAPEEAQRYHAESKKQIDTNLMLKEQLIAELGFISGQFLVPDDFDTMAAKEIELLFGVADE
ncbi:hypothetical protein [Iodobacter fluviatilis]|uniref:XRE family transcriptional regulator n=1 Tax=Iodobacter fluviatilis TaxID=537 RepID=A0A377Q387_9NEIS|nr:hypothetical protein [Iodobacter fluviatilis]TCU90250.1 hypothetical protein EV682_101275 [Iodobacter fluviatilis]STQ89277.1 Uncharacterised protein [Iodobacter fluviatilis]